MNRIVAVVAVILMGFGVYAQTKSAPSVSTFTDSRDGKTYKIVKLGTAVWMAENLNYAAEGSKCYNNSPDSCAKYGRLYDWKTALTACPVGTHLPTDKEWTTLTDFDGDGNIAGKLKSSAGWNDNDNSTNAYLFSALPGGEGSLADRFKQVGDVGFWWSATEDDARSAWIRDMRSQIQYVRRYSNSKGDMFSVRCVQN